MEVLFGLFVGVGLSAACGFRVFVPLLVMGIASRTGHLGLPESYDWVAGTPALIAFGVATLLEIGAYYIPWLDNALDTVATPAAVVAGILTTNIMIADMSPMLSWSVAIIAGGGTAGIVQVGTSATRHASLITTGGIGNPVISTVEFIGATLMSILAIVLPVLAIFVVGLLFYLTYRAFRRFRNRKRPLPA